MKQTQRILFSFIFLVFVSSTETISAAMLQQQEIFKTGCVSGNCENGFGTFIYENGDKYKGGWKNGLYSGLGTFTSANGVRKSGKWTNGKIAGSFANANENSTWERTGANSNKIVNSDGDVLNNVKILKLLGTQDLAVLDKDSRAIYLLKNHKNAAVGSKGKVSLLKSNVSNNFFISTKNSFAVYIKDSYEPVTFSNINGSYIAYSNKTERCYVLNNISSYSSWISDNLETLAFQLNNAYWYRDAAKKSYGIIKKGKPIDYSNVTSKKEDDDLIISENGIKKYALRDYYNTVSFKFTPVTNYSNYTKEKSVKNKDCVSGNCYDGWGKMNYSNGYYQGFWKNGLKHGYGLYKWKESEGKYIGNWTNDKMTGYGVYLGKDGDEMVGQYENGKLNGLAHEVENEKWTRGIFRNGTIQTSYSFVSNGKKTGCTAGDCNNKYGRYKWANGDIYSGFFKNGKLHMGTYEFANGDKYSGMFNSSEKFQGMGRYFFKSGGYYGGEWKNGKRHGKGYYHDKDYKQQIGDWSYGSLLKKI